MVCSYLGFSVVNDVTDTVAVITVSILVTDDTADDDCQRPSLGTLAHVSLVFRPILQLPVTVDIEDSAS